MRAYGATEGLNAGVPNAFCSGPDAWFACQTADVVADERVAEPRYGSCTLRHLVPFLSVGSRLHGALSQPMVVKVPRASASLADEVERNLS